MLKEWHIEDISGIKLGEACSNYVNHLGNVTNNFEPIYIVAALLPCVKLWPWIGEEIGAERVRLLYILNYLYSTMLWLVREHVTCKKEFSLNHKYYYRTSSSSNERKLILPILYNIVHYIYDRKGRIRFLCLSV